jgi:hypothetical protein
MNTADFAIAAIGVTSLANTGCLAYGFHRMADRVRVVNPVKDTAKEKGGQVPQSDGRPVSVLGGPSYGEASK